MKKKFTVVINMEGDAYIARCPDVEDAITQGLTADEAIDKMRQLLKDRFKAEGGEHGHES